MYFSRGILTFCSQTNLSIRPNPWVGGGGGGGEDRGKLRRRISSEKSDTQVTHMHFFFSFLFFSFLFFFGEFRLEYSYVPLCQSYVLVCTRMYSYVTRMYSYVTVRHSYIPVWCISHYLRNPTKHTIGHRRSISGNRPPSGNVHRKMPPNL